MHNLKSRIKRRKQGRGISQNSPSSSSATSSVGADWEFVNFNPFVYGPSRPSSSESPCVSLVRAPQSHHEDYYEFPTSTKLHANPSAVSSSATAQARVRDQEGRENHLQYRYHRHSLNSALDLLAPVRPAEHNLNYTSFPPPLAPPKVPDASKTTPVPVTSTLSNSKFYLPTPPQPEISRRSSLSSVDPTKLGYVPLGTFPHELDRSRSWDSDSGTGTMVIHPKSEHDVGGNSGGSQVATSFTSKRSDGVSLPSGTTPSSVTTLIEQPPPPPPRNPTMTGGASRNGILQIGKFYINISTCDKPLSSSGSSSSNLKTDRRPDTLSEERLTNDGLTYEDNKDRANQEPRRSSNAVGRSESCKERVQRKQPRERRKHSDPNLTTKTSDVDLENQNLADSNNSSSSSSSLSARSLDSPSTSLELVAPSGHSSSSLPGRNSETPDTTVGHSALDSYKLSQSWEGDSDIEVEHDAPDWTRDVPEDILSQLEPREKKRQEVLNELFHTERSHVRNLKVVDRLFHRPIRLQQLLPPDLVQMLFASWEELLEIHVQFNTALKKKRKENPLIGDIGPLLLEVFDGEKAESFKKAAASCCAKQQIGLKFLKERREKSPKLNTFLQEAEQDPVCRRLQVQDMIPMAMQRLTKYPLMFEKLSYHSAADTTERRDMQRALEMSKEILNGVNHAKKEAEDHQRLEEIQRKLDKSSLEKGILSMEKGVDKPDVNFINELRNLDVTSHKLIYEGQLHWRLKSNKQKSEVQQEVQLVLLHDMVVILLKQDDRFVLKIHSSPSYPGKAERVISRPVIKLNNLIHRANAADKKAFMLINMTSTNMYDLVCSSMEERKVWLHHITKAAEDYKSRQESRRSDFHPNTNIPSVPEPADHSKESGEPAEIGDADLSTTSDANCAPPNDASPATDSIAGGSTSENSTGSEKLAAGNGSGPSRSVSASPNPVRNVGEFLRVTESSPLIDPSEVLVTSRDIQFAQTVLSPYEELKRVDSSITKGLDDKMKLVSQILHIPPAKDSSSTLDGKSSEMASPLPSGDAKELIVACMQQVDQLGRILAEQKITNENMPVMKEQSGIQRSLNVLLTQLLAEVHRKEEELEVRRQELHRVREQNHGYQERLQNKSKAERLVPSPVKGSSKALPASPNLSPSQSRPNNIVSLSSASDHPEDEEVVMMKTRSKPQSCDPVAISSCSLKDAVPQLLEAVEYELPSSVSNESQISDSACDLAPDEFADAVEELPSETDSLGSDEKGESNWMSTSTLTLVDSEQDSGNVENEGPSEKDRNRHDPSSKVNLSSRIENGKSVEDPNLNKSD